MPITPPSYAAGGLGLSGYRRDGQIATVSLELDDDVRSDEVKGGEEGRGQPADSKFLWFRLWGEQDVQKGEVAPVMPRELFGIVSPREVREGRRGEEREGELDLS